MSIRPGDPVTRELIGLLDNYELRLTRMEGIRGSGAASVEHGPGGPVIHWAGFDGLLDMPVEIVNTTVEVTNVLVFGGDTLVQQNNVITIGGSIGGSLTINVGGGPGSTTIIQGDNITQNFYDLTLNIGGIVINLGCGNINIGPCGNLLLIDTVFTIDDQSQLIITPDSGGIQVIQVPIGTTIGSFTTIDDVVNIDVDKPLIPFLNFDGVLGGQAGLPPAQPDSDWFKFLPRSQGGKFTMKKGGILGGALYGGWRIYTLTFSAFSDIDTEKTVVVATLPARGWISGVAIKHSQAFTGGTISALSISVLIDGTGVASLNCFAAPSNTGFSHANETDIKGLATFNLFNFGATIDLALSAQSTGGNLNALTQGSVDVWFYTNSIPTAN